MSPLQGWQAKRSGGAPGERGEVARIVFDAGHVGTAMNLDFAYDDAEAAGFLREDLAHIAATWPGSADDLARVRRYAAGH